MEFTIDELHIIASAMHVLYMERLDTDTSESIRARVREEIDRRTKKEKRP